MGAAEVIAFEEVRASKQWHTLRQRLHARFDQWLDTLDQQWHEPPSTLMEVTAMVWAVRQELTGGLTETIIEQVQRGEHDRTQVPCPRCAEIWQAREFVCRTVDTMVGSVQVERPYCYCRSCHVGYSPFDEAVGLVAGCTQIDIHKAAANVVTKVPYETAQALLRELTGLPLGSERMHTMVNHVAEDLTVLDVTPSREEITRRVAAVAAGRWRHPVLVMGIDGAYVPTRPESAREPQEGPRRTRAKRARWRGQGRDAKGFRLYLLDGERIVHLCVGIGYKRRSNSVRRSHRSKRPG